MPILTIVAIVCTFIPPIVFHDTISHNDSHIFSFGQKVSSQSCRHDGKSGQLIRILLAIKLYV